jgi:uncharacterized LabA/DUF88 family protein
MLEPTQKRAVAFIDGQNLYRHAKDAFGYHYPNYDPIKLANAVCQQNAWQQCGVRFYTGTPDVKRDPKWHRFWSNRLLQMTRSGVLVTKRPLRYRELQKTTTTGEVVTIESVQEKGIDVRLALDVIRLGLQKQYDVALIFSQDQDLSEIVADLRELSKSQLRWIKIVSAFPVSPTATSQRGVNNTDWIRIDRETYDACIDPHDYRGP